MRILTGELVAWSYQQLTNVAGSVELDFNLSRGTALVVNKILGQIGLGIVEEATLVAWVAAQELDLDPDNTALIGGHPTIATDKELNSTRIFRQNHQGIFRMDDTATQALAYATNPNAILEMNWYHINLPERPKTIDNLRHHAEIAASANDVADFWLQIFYQVVELSDAEIAAAIMMRR